MKKYLAILALASTCFAGESYNYISLGTSSLIVPTIQFGHREGSNDGALDFSIGFASVFVASEISGNFDYIKTTNEDGVFVGTGIKSGLILSPDYVQTTFSPKFIFGKENASNFHKVSIAPVEFSNYGTEFTSLNISYQYGFKF